jgi:hypothetical protein
LYLFVTLCFDAARLRTFVLSSISEQERLLFAAFATSYGVRCALFVAFNVPERASGTPAHDITRGLRSAVEHRPTDLDPATLHRPDGADFLARLSRQAGTRGPHR